MLGYLIMVDDIKITHDSMLLDIQISWESSKFESSLFICRYCGNRTGEIIQYLPEDGDDVHLQFHSDSTDTLRGFYIQVLLKPGRQVSWGKWLYLHIKPAVLGILNILENLVFKCVFLYLYGRLAVKWLWLMHSNNFRCITIWINLHLIWLFTSTKTLIGLRNSHRHVLNTNYFLN